jgi:hypothetical protein
MTAHAMMNWHGDGRQLRFTCSIASIILDIGSAPRGAVRLVISKVVKAELAIAKFTNILAQPLDLFPIGEFYESAKANFDAHQNDRPMPRIVCASVSLSCL